MSKTNNDRQTISIRLSADDWDKLDRIRDILAKEYMVDSSKTGAIRWLIRKYYSQLTDRAD